MFLNDKEKAMMGQSLQSFLIMPMQRICRMPLLLDAVIKKTDAERNPGQRTQLVGIIKLYIMYNKCNSSRSSIMLSFFKIFHHFPALK